MKAAAYRFILSGLVICLISLGRLNAEEGKTTASKSADDTSITMIVMDPLSAPLACDCVQGYANRQYQRLSEHLEKSLDVRVKIFWSESLAEAISSKTSGQCDLVIGKDSVVRHQASALKRKFVPIASLTGLDGKTTQKGLFVVKAKSTIASVIDLEGAKLLYGLEECDEKYRVPREHFRVTGSQAIGQIIVRGFL